MILPYTAPGFINQVLLLFFTLLLLHHVLHRERTGPVAAIASAMETNVYDQNSVNFEHVEHSEHKVQVFGGFTAMMTCIPGKYPGEDIWKICGWGQTIRDKRAPVMSPRGEGSSWCIFIIIMCLYLYLL